MKRGWIQIWVSLLAAMAAVWSAPAHAGSAADAGTPLATCLARVTPGDTPAAILRGGPQFDCATEQHRLGEGNFWVLSTPLPADTPSHRVRIRMMSLWQDAVTVYALYGDGKVAVLSDTSATLSRRVQLGAVIEFAAPVRAAPIQRILLRVDGSANRRGVVMNLRLATPGESGNANTVMAAIYAGFVGLGCALLFYNLALWGTLRHRFQVAYCVMVAVLILYAVSSSGALAWWWPAIDNNDRIRVNYVLLGLAAASALLFARTFFEPKVFAGRFGRFMVLATTAVAASGFMFAAASHIDMPLADYLTAGLFIFGLSAVVPMLWHAWRRGSAYLTLFAIAWAVPVLFAGLRILASVHWLPISFWIDNSTVLSLAFESLVSSLAIAYRVQVLSRERDEAKASEVLARRLADADPLTGLINRRAFLDAAVGRTGEQTLHVIDIDHFKSVNDTLGHDGGDEVLRVFARTLRQSVPASALTARMGGEEFAVLADASAPVDAETLLAKLRAARMPFDLSVTASVGTSSGPLETDLHWKLLYRDADRALFEAKAAGRDRARRAPMRAAA